MKKRIVAMLLSLLMLMTAFSVVAVAEALLRNTQKKYSGRIPFLHARDTDMKEDTAVGCGVVDFKAVVAAAGGVEWIIVENPWIG